MRQVVEGLGSGVVEGVGLRVYDLMMADVMWEVSRHVARSIMPCAHIEMQAYPPTLHPSSFQCVFDASQKKPACIASLRVKRSKKAQQQQRPGARGVTLLGMEERVAKGRQAHALDPR